MPAYMTTQRHIIFDLDGTLIDSAPGIIAAFRAVLDAKQIVPQCALNDALIGPPLAETMTRLTGISEPHVLTELTDAFKLCYDDKGVRSTHAYEGIDALLNNLYMKQFNLHIATNKRIAPTQSLVMQLKWSAYFSSLNALDMVSPRLPDKAALLARMLPAQGLAANDCIYVGDKHEDGIAADANQIPFVAVTWGYGDFDNVTLPTHWRLAATPSDLRAMLCV